MSDDEVTRGAKLTGGIILALIAAFLLAYPAAFLVHVAIRLATAGWDGPGV